VYGSKGYDLGGWNSGSSDLGSLPNATFTLDQGSRWCWTCSTTDVRALQNPDGVSPRHAATWYHYIQLRAHLTFSTAFSGDLRLYALDWGSTTRREKVTVNDGSATGNQVLDLTTAFNQGAWITFPVSVKAGGTITITIDRTAGSNAVLSGIFLDDAAPPDTTTTSSSTTSSSTTSPTSSTTSTSTTTSTTLPPPPPSSAGSYCAPSIPTSPAGYQTTIDNLRKANTGWASADGSIPVALPDGRMLWLYGDTFVGPVSSSGTLPTTLVSNSAILQSGACFYPLLGGSSSSRTAWIAPPASGQAYWPASAVVDSAGRLQVFLMHVQYNPFTVFGFRIATYSLPSLSLVSISSLLPFTDTVHPYGTTALVAGGYAYLYSAHDQDQLLARVPLSSVTSSSAYQFWTGSGWSSSSSAAAALQFNNVPTPVVGIDLHAPIAGLWVVPYGNGYLGTAKLVNQFSDDVSLFTAPAPQGPWTYVGRAATTPSGLFSYGAVTSFLLTGLGGSAATIYSTNVSGTPTTITQYGPRFVAPSNLPAPLP
jgi:hypothetical protein